MGPEIIGWFVSGLTAIVVTILSFILAKKSKKEEEDRAANIERDKKITELEKAAIRADNKFVTNEQLRLAIQEAFEPYKEDNKEIKLMLRQLTEELGNISKDLAIINAIRRSNGGSGYNSGSGGGNS